MKKFKIITTICALILTIALLGFGVYAATKSKFTIKSTISFEVTDTFVKVSYGVENIQDFGPYYSDSRYGEPLLSNYKNLPNLKFTEEERVYTYYLKIENLHQQADQENLHLRMAYRWKDSTKYEGNAITVNSVFYTYVQGEEGLEEIANEEWENTETFERVDGKTNSINYYQSEDLDFVDQTTVMLKIIITLAEDATDYALNGGLELKVLASLQTTNELTFD